MKEIRQKANAKLNFTLDIVGKRDDGYHIMDMVMQAVDLYDDILIKTNKGPISLTCEGINLDSESNIAYKAAKAFFEETRINGGCEIEIKKRIPVGAGMGGGSADGAAVIDGLNRLYEANLSTEKLIQIGARVGADIPFCIVGGTARVQGIGEKVTSIEDCPSCFFVVAKPRAWVNTKQAFEDFDKIVVSKRPDTEEVIKSIKNGDILTAAEGFCNVFEQVIIIREAEDIKAFMRLCGGINPMMTGSGSAVFTTFLDEEKAVECYYKLSELSINAYICKPIKGTRQ